MPTPDEIIAAFKESSKNEEWAKKPETYAPVEQELRDIMNDPDPNSYSAKTYQFMEKHKGSPQVGTACCQALLEKGDAGKVVATDVAKRVMSNELDRYQVSAAGFIRGQHAINGFTKQFIQSTSPDCDRQVKARVEDLAQKYKAQGIDQVASGNDWQAKTKMTTELGKDMVEVMATTPMTQDSANFLKEMRDTIEQHQGFAAKFKEAKPGATTKEIQDAQRDLAEIVVNNNAALRFTSPLIKTNPTLGRNELWKDASSASLSTYSGARKDELKPKLKHSDVAIGGSDGPRTIVLTPDQIAENQHLVDISKNIHTSKSMVLEMQDKLKAGRIDPNLEAQKHREMQDLTAKLEPQMAKISANEKRIADLNKPISVEKIKAFFSRKGVEGTKEQLKSEILDIQKNVKTSIDDITKHIALAKDKQEIQQKTGLDPDKLDSALKLPAVNKAMMSFAKKEFASENLEYMEAVNQFKEMAKNGASIEDLRKSAQEIRDTFLEKPDGGFQVGSLDQVSKTVNLSSDVRDRLEKSLDKLSQSKPDERNFQTWGSDLRKEMSEAFDESNHQVLKMTENDTFRRFKQDPSYKEAMQKSAKNGLDDPSVGKTLGIDKNARKIEAPKHKIGVS